MGDHTHFFGILQSCDFLGSDDHVSLISGITCKSDHLRMVPVSYYDHHIPGAPVPADQALNFSNIRAGGVAHRYPEALDFFASLRADTVSPDEYGLIRFRPVIITHHFYTAALENLDSLGVMDQGAVRVDSLAGLLGMFEHLVHRQPDTLAESRCLCQ